MAKLLFPERCVGCLTWGSLLCPDCLVMIAPRPHPVCPGCLEAVGDGRPHRVCRQVGTPDYFLAPFRYRGVVQKLIRAMKFRRDRRLAVVLAGLLIEEIEENSDLYRFFTERRPLVVPVPLGRRRLRERGFNQAALLGRRIAVRWRLDYAEGALMRIKETPPQSLLPYQARLTGVEGVFRVKKTFGKAPQAVLLVDDVLTTGATIKACTAVLRRAGVREIWAVTAAH